MVEMNLLRGIEKLSRHAYRAPLRSLGVLRRTAHQIPRTSESSVALAADESCIALLFQIDGFG
jgi:hypothetical protein